VLSALFALTAGVVTANPFVAVGLFAGSQLIKFAPIQGSLMAVITPADITWNGKEAMSMTEAIMESAYTNPAIADINRITEGIVASQQIAFLGTLSKITKAKTTCGGSAGTHAISMSEKYWNPKRTEYWISECADNLEESFWVWGLNKGIARKDLTTTDFNEFVSQRIEEALVEDMLRIVWFNDTAHDDVDASPAGVLTSGTDLADYTIIDGLWSQIYDEVALDSNRRYTIALNSQGTYANQAFDSTDTTNKLAHEILNGVVSAADYRLKSRKDKVLLVTQSIYDQYYQELKSYANIPASYEMVQNGKSTLSYDGIPVIPIDFWDRTIRADFDNGAAWYQPHRVLLTIKDNIPVGVESIDATKAMEVWYERKEQTTNWRGGFKIDAKLLQSEMFQAGY
jgi:hypothetical protein